MKLASLFTNGAVLQQQQTVPVWGETVACGMVKVSINGNEGFARASHCGDFMLQLPPMNAGGPYDMVVSVEDHPEEDVVLHDIYIGEVWLCSGQSNLAYMLGHSKHVPMPAEGEIPLSRQQEKEFIDTVCPDKELRYITVSRWVTGRRERYFEDSWKYIDASNASEASAAGAWFAAEMRKKLNVPVGVIFCAKGGSIIEAWTSTGALRSNPDTREYVDKWEAFRSKQAAWGDRSDATFELLKDTLDPDPGSNGLEKELAAENYDDSNWKSMQIPGSWINQKIAGNGAVWVRRKFYLDADYAGEDLQLELGGIDKHDITYINGVEVGRTGKKFDSQFCTVLRSYPVPGKLLHPGENTIAIRAFSHAFDGAFNALEENYVLKGGNVEVHLAGEWKVYVEFDRGKVEIPYVWGVEDQHTPTLLFDSMIRPVMPFAVRGVLWYQGESNAVRMSDTYLYLRQLETMIRDWRYNFEQPDLPFVQVQLADYRNKAQYDELSNWAVLRDAQRRACDSINETFMVTALGTGEIRDIHPQNKKEVGKRLAAATLYHIYKKNDELPSGPVFKYAQNAGNKLNLYFDFADGMELRDEPGKGFYLAGKDKVYFPADRAEISGKMLTLSSNAVAEPCFVRYAWSDNPENILWNKEYPAAAFGSDDDLFASKQN